MMRYNIIICMKTLFLILSTYISILYSFIIFFLYAIVKTWRPEQFSIGLRFKLLGVIVRNPNTNINTIVNYWAIYDTNDISCLLLKLLYNNSNVKYITITINNIPTTCIVFLDSIHSGFNFQNNTINFPLSRIPGLFTLTGFGNFKSLGIESPDLTIWMLFKFLNINICGIDGRLIPYRYPVMYVQGVQWDIRPFMVLENDLIKKNISFYF